jgi:hypothetical protein
MLLFITPFSVVASVKNNVINLRSLNNSSQTCFLDHWIETQKILASDGDIDDNFGISVAIDENTILVGSYLDDDSGDASGSVYVFVRSGATWTLQTKLHALDADTHDLFGCSVAIDGDTALIGALIDEANGPYSGSAYVFTRSGTTWTQQAKLLASDGTSGDEFGNSVSLEGDTALIGAYWDDELGNLSGSSYVFTRSGTIWTQQAKLLSSDGEAWDRFGESVCINGDTALIGAWGDSENGPYSGSAYVFTRSGTTWTQQAKLLASDGETDDTFGYSVSLDYNTALIGSSADDDNGPYSGSVYVFTRSGTIWTQQTELYSSDASLGQGFGWSVCLDGDTALIGAKHDDDNGQDGGAAFVFTRTGATWTQQEKLLTSDGTMQDYFGYSVSLSGDTALIGAWGNDDYGQNSGSAYVFVKDTENGPPNKPSINGPPKGDVGDTYIYTFVAVDPDNDNIYYEIDWGDGVVDDLYGPVGSNVVIQRSHKWELEGTFTIKARAIDIYDAIGEWGSLTVTMPCLYNIPFLSFWEKLFERFPNAFPILRQLVGY